MEEVLGYSAIHAGLCYLPVTVGAGLGAGVATKAIPKIGTRAADRHGCAAGRRGGVPAFRIPMHGTYLPDILPGIVIMGAGVGLVLVERSKWPPMEVLAGRQGWTRPHR